MLPKNLGKGLLIGFLGLGLSAVQAAVQPAAEGAQAIPARAEEMAGSYHFQKVDRDGHFGHDFDRGRGFRNHDFDFGFGYGYYDPWWPGGWAWGYGYPYWGAYPSYYYNYAPSPATGKVKIETPVQDARVYVDGGYIGTVHDRNQFKLDTGVHNLKVKAPDGATFDQKIDVLKGQTLIVRPDLEPPAHAER